MIVGVMLELELNTILKKASKIVFGLSGILLMSSCADHAQSNSETVINSPGVKVGDRAVTEVRQSSDRHETAKARAQALREQSKLQAQQRQSQLHEQRLARKALMEEQRAARKAQTDQERTRHLNFKAELVSMLIEDSIIVASQAVDLDVKITYLDGDILANGVNLSERFSQKYPSLWLNYDRMISDDSYILINETSYEIREISDTGGSYHFMMQTN